MKKYGRNKKGPRYPASRRKLAEHYNLMYVFITGVFVLQIYILFLMSLTSTLTHL